MLKIIVLPTGRKSTLLLLDSRHKLFLVTNVNGNRQGNKKPKLSELSVCTNFNFSKFISIGNSPNIQSGCVFTIVAACGENSISLNDIAIDLKKNELTNIQSYALPSWPTSAEVNDISRCHSLAYIATTKGLLKFDLAKSPIAAGLIDMSIFKHITVTSDNSIYCVKNGCLIKFSPDNTTTMLNSTTEAPKDGNLLTARIQSAKCVSSVGESVIFVDSRRVRIITAVSKLKDFLNILRELANLFGYMPIGKCRNINLESAISRLPRIEDNWEKVESSLIHAVAREGESGASSLESTQGFLTRQSRLSVAHQFRMIRYIYVFVVKLKNGLETLLLMKNLTEIYVERLFSLVGLLSKNPNALSMNQFAYAQSKADKAFFQSMVFNKTLMGAEKNSRRYGTGTAANDVIEKSKTKPAFLCISRTQAMKHWRLGPFVKAESEISIDLCNKYGKGYRTGKVRSFGLKFGGTLPKANYLGEGERRAPGIHRGNNNNTTNTNNDNNNNNNNNNDNNDSNMDISAEGGVIRIPSLLYNASGGGGGGGQADSNDFDNMHLSFNKSLYESIFVREVENKDLVFDEVTYVAYWVDKNVIDSYEYEIAQILRSNEIAITLEKIKDVDETSIDISGAFEIPNEQLICILPQCLKLDADMDAIHEIIYNEIFSTTGQTSRPQILEEDDDEDDDEEEEEDEEDDEKKHDGEEEEDNDDVVDNAMGEDDFI